MRLVMLLPPSTVWGSCGGLPFPLDTNGGLLDGNEKQFDETLALAESAVKVSDNEELDGNNLSEISSMHNFCGVIVLSEKSEEFDKQLFVLLVINGKSI
jgi:hypothetical protein